MTQLQDRTVVVQEPGRSGGGMGLGVMLGLILAGVLGVAVLWFAFGGNRTGGATGTTPAAGNTNDVTIQTPAGSATGTTPAVGNTNPVTIQAPDIKIPDTITVNTNTTPQ